MMEIVGPGDVCYFEVRPDTSERKGLIDCNQSCWPTSNITSFYSSVND